MIKVLTIWSNIPGDVELEFHLTIVDAPYGLQLHCHWQMKKPCNTLEKCYPYPFLPTTISPSQVYSYYSNKQSVGPLGDLIGAAILSSQQMHEHIATRELYSALGLGLGLHMTRSGLCNRYWVLQTQWGFGYCKCLSAIRIKGSISKRSVTDLLTCGHLGALKQDI
jgi:hypothetical protein